MATSIDQARREVQSVFQAMVGWAESPKRRSFQEFESELWRFTLALGRALVALFLVVQCQRTRKKRYLHKGVEYKLVGKRTSDLGTRFGKVKFTRPIGRRPEARRDACDLPVDRDLGLCAGFSLGVVVFMTRLCAQMAYAGARATYKDIHEWAPSPRAAMRMVDAAGDQARPFLQQAPAPLGDGEILVIQVDAGGAPMISKTEHRRRRGSRKKTGDGPKRHQRRRRRKANQRPRRTKGKKSKNAKMAVVGVLYTLKRTPDGVEGPINKKIFATFASHEELFIWLKHEADKRGYDEKRSIFLSDGSKAIWKGQQRYFPKSEACLDWFHLLEKLWAVGQTQHREGSDELRAWVGKQARRLRRGHAKAVKEELEAQFASIPRTGPGNKGKRERLKATINYFNDNLDRMPYDKLRRDDLDIGSGAVEGAVRNLVRMRLDGPGMRWSRQRSERILHLRCILLNGQWQEFCEYLARLPDFTLAAQPEPTIPHTAKAAA